MLGYLWEQDDSDTGVVIPEVNIKIPVRAIMSPLSMQNLGSVNQSAIQCEASFAFILSLSHSYLSSVAYSLALWSSAMSDIIFWSLVLPLNTIVFSTAWRKARLRDNSTPYSPYDQDFAGARIGYSPLYYFYEHTVGGLLQGIAYILCARAGMRGSLQQPLNGIEYPREGYIHAFDRIRERDVILSPGWNKD